jgi:hypothetical protein
MNLLPLTDFRSDLVPGRPLPWGVRNAQGHLLLARGQLISSAAMVTALLDHGMFVEAGEVSQAAAPEAPPAGSPFARWEQICANLAEVLRSPGERQFLRRIRDAAQQVLALDEVNTDLLLFLILRQDYGRFESYGVTHSLHVACVCSLLARRLGWDRADQERVIGAALTMNLTIVDLQGRLACQSTPLTRHQREQIDGHPQQASFMLRAAGLDDEPWLTAVEDHHLRRNSSSYPGTRADATTMSQLLRLTDQFTAKHSARATRPALPAQQAARELFTQNPGDPLAALLIKEFGIYPPGCLVKLASGEVGIVVRRGASANTPQVATLTNARREAVTSPQLRDSAQSAHAIVGGIPETTLRLQVPPHLLYPEAVA